ncbi:MAG: tetratricopeptide repeat protein [Gemmatales bacterium]|nr:tetratricopeptide repeat protein [Gemmatales bacterium]MDW8223544.1 tetratricopeptide repeat protein [Gemmatales bacterium]
MADTSWLSSEGWEAILRRPNTLQEMAEENQLKFELRFFATILQRYPDYVDVLRHVGQLLTQVGLYPEALEVDLRLVRLRPQDAVAHYNLACTYARLYKTDSAIRALKRAVELGYRDYRYIKQDRDLDPIRDDPRYRELMRQLESGGV